MRNLTFHSIVLYSYQEALFQFIPEMRTTLRISRENDSIVSAFISCSICLFVGFNSYNLAIISVVSLAASCKICPYLEFVRSVLLEVLDHATC